MKSQKLSSSIAAAIMAQAAISAVPIIEPKRETPAVLDRIKRVLEHLREQFQGHCYIRGTPEQIERLRAIAEDTTAAPTLFDMPVVVLDSAEDRSLEQLGVHPITLSN